MTNNAHLLEVKDLVIAFRGSEKTVTAVSGVSFHVNRGETLGIVGESGCGKSVTSLAVMRLLPQATARVSGDITFDGEELLALPEDDMPEVRGNRISMVFQEPMTSLNPVYTIGKQIDEAILLHQNVGAAKAREMTLDMLKKVGIPRAEEISKEYPYQLSGGMRQRVMIAMALVCRPRLLIADEPTTALDVTTQRQILELIDDLRDEYQMGVILITHDLGVVAGHTDRVAVMYAGRVVEEASTRDLFADPRHRYTNSLLAALPERALRHGEKLFAIPGSPPALREEPVGCRFVDRCPWAMPECSVTDPVLSGDGGHSFACLNPRLSGESMPSDGDVVVERCVVDSGDATETGVVADVPPRAAAPAEASDDVVLEITQVSKEYAAVSSGLFRRKMGTVSAVDRVSLRLERGRTYGLVGESGCGKSTMGRLIAGLEPPTGGDVEILGTDITKVKGPEKRRIHQDVQMMFQDSYAAMDPRMRIDEILAEPLRIQKMGSGKDITGRIEKMVAQVGLPADALDRYPHEFSGGQLQRIGLARSLTLAPDVIVADEPVSALDVSVQAQVLNLMKDLQEEYGMSYVFISHDLAVVQYMADRIGVMYLGRLVEEGPADEVVRNPRHPYTQALIEAIPVPDPAYVREESIIQLQGEPPSAIDPPSGCRFRTRCPFATEECQTEPALVGGAHRVACHFPLPLREQKDEPVEVGA